MRLILACLLILGPYGALANAHETGPLGSSDHPAIQDFLDSFAEAWMTGDRPTLERVLHEDYTYFTSREADAKSWGRDTEIDYACRVAEAGTVQSVSVTATKIAGGGTEGEFSVAARWDVRLIRPAGGDAFEASTDVQFLLTRDQEGRLRLWRQVDATRPNP